MTLSFQASGKLLISGEYAVLDGAEALACPTRKGQTLEFSPQQGNFIWESYTLDDKLWFRGIFNPRSFEILSTSDSSIATRLTQILQAVSAVKNDWQLPLEGQVQCRLAFDPQWGLGSSSTLISLIAQWASIDPYRLLQQTFGGSGYDIACAQAAGPISYQLKEDSIHVEEVKFKPPFHKQLYFVYRNQKQNSRLAMQHYRSQTIPADFIGDISAISRELIDCQQQEDFNRLLYQHEKLMGQVLKLQPIQTELFSDFQGQIKSLGAWGGDFFLASCMGAEPKDYFQKKGYTVVIPFYEMLKI